MTYWLDQVKWYHLPFLLENRCARWRRKKWNAYMPHTLRRGFICLDPRSFIPREIFNDVCALHLLSTGSSKILSKTSLRTSKTISLLNINNISKNTIKGVSIHTKTTTGQRIVHVSRFFLSHDVHNSVTFGRGVGRELDDLKACTQHIN